MENLLKCKEKLIELYSEYDIYINSIAKFLLSLMMFFIISETTNAGGIIGNPAVMLIAALVCMFMPKIGMTYIVALYSLAAVYSVSMEYAIVIAFIMLIVVLLYMQFSPEYGYMILVSTAACALNLQLLLVVVAGLLVGPACIVPVACGIIVYFVFGIVPEYLALVNDAGLESGIEKFKYIADNAVLNKEMIITVAASVLVIILVYIIKRREINYSWIIAVLAGSVFNLPAILIGAAVMNTSVDVFRIIIGTVISLLLSFVVCFFMRNPDYKKIERVQFEDDEYYYYVKAVPKKTAAKNTSVKNRIVKEYLDEGDA